MKTFRLIGMALVAVMMCLNFAACNSDDEPEQSKDESGIILNEKRLIKMQSAGDVQYNYTLSYDSKKRLSSFVSGSSIYNATWGENCVSIDWYNYIIYEGLVRNSEDEEVSFAYNSSNQLIFYDSNSRNIDFVWENGKIIKSNWGNQATTITNSKDVCKGYFPPLLLNLNFNTSRHIILAHPELFGLRSTQLPNKITITEKQNYWDYNNHYEYISQETTYDYSYTLDKDGYVTGCVENVMTKEFYPSYTGLEMEEYITDQQTNTYTFTWE